MNAEQLKLIAEEAKNELSRRYYRDYIVTVHRGHYKHFRHTELICDELQPIAEGEQRFIVVELPPRHGKSMTITETFPSYYLMRNPDKRVITAAYSDGLANKFGRLNRNKFEEYSHLFGLKLSEEKSAAKDWNVEGHHGGMIATGIGGSITGQGADLMIIDDPIKNAQEAASPTTRERIWAEWESTLSTRLHHGASVIVVMTRWHEDDLVGQLLEKSPYEWKRIRLPAIAEDEDDALGREVGQALCPELGFDEEWAAQKKISVGSRTWASLYQQRPSPGEGAIINRKWFKYYKVMPHRFDEVIASWDLTFKDADSSDYVVGQVWGRIGADKYLIDQTRAKMDFPTTIQAIKQLNRKHRKCRTTLIEDKANGPAVIATLKKEIPGIVPVNPEGGKVVRAQAITPDIEAGNVYLPEEADWVMDFVEECVVFPNGKHDDQVDCMSQAVTRLNTRRAAFVSSENGW